MHVLLAIDPGTTQSGWALMTDARDVICHGKSSNDYVIDCLMRGVSPGREELIWDRVVFERPTGRPHGIGPDMVETYIWYGRMAQAVQVWSDLQGRGIGAFNRQQVKKHLLSKTTGTDAEVRSAVIAAYGGKEMAIGTKAKPGPLHGVKADAWQAIALGLTAIGS